MVRMRCMQLALWLLVWLLKDIVMIEYADLAGEILPW